MPFFVSFESRAVRVDVVGRRPALRLRVDGRDHEVVDEPEGGGAFTIVVDGRAFRGFRLTTPSSVWIRIEGRTYAFDRSVVGAGPASSSDTLEVRADMPGIVVAVHVEVGADVQEGDPLVTLESMKLQLTVGAARNGRVARVLVEPGAAFERGTVLLAYAGAPAARTGGLR
jgi:3-methylcrotonyl-CoA carboxylase alpha subunit